MLGWEFPPLVTGGLGRACEGLFRALERYADLTVIVPRSDPAFAAEHFNLLGLNQITPDDIRLVREQAARSYDVLKEVVMVETDLSPYPVPVVKVVMQLQTETEQPEAEVLDAQAVRDLYGEPDNYGPRTMEKVAAFTEIVARLASNYEFDLIHAHDWLTMRAGMEVKRLTGKPLVVHIHSLETDRVGPGYGRKVENEIYKMEYEGMLNADLIVPVSHYTKRQILAHYPGLDPDRICPVYNAIDAPAGLELPNLAPPNPQPVPIIPLEQADGAAEAGPLAIPPRKIVLFVGRVTYQKGPAFLLETAQKLLAQDPTVLFVVAGTGNLQEWLAQKVAETHLGSNFIFMGFLAQDRLTELLHRASVYFMPSISEPFGLAALEAGQAGVPSVLSRQSGVAEVLQGGVLTADCWDTDQFANYIHALLNYHALRETLAEENRAAIQSLSWDKAAQEVLALYLQLLFD
jgi:glycosyltransferase involved in cell wall biosynthesis